MCHIMPSPVGVVEAVTMESQTHPKPCCYSQADNTTFNLPNLVGGSSQYVVTSTGINNNGPPGVVDISTLATQV